ncbi:MAG: nitroreductase [Nitrospirae bacterium]|nr:nitroreductase [Nitrospirota bacterium]MBS1242932.1 nitroreductase [Nitrospirota bacterium]
MRVPFLSALIIALLLCGAVAAEQQLTSQQLPAPQTDSGRPLMQVLKERSTSRSFSARKLPLQVLSNLLWAAFGVNRPESGHRTAPSAKDRQEIDIYVAMAEGLYVYEAKTHVLQPVLAVDIRAMTGRQSFVADAPVNLVYVADLGRMGKVSKEEQDLYSAADTGFISENVYLFCASEGLATVVRGSVDRETLAKAMRLRPDQKIILAQTVGYPKK